MVELGFTFFSVVKAPYCCFQNSYHWLSSLMFLSIWFPLPRMVYLLLFFFLKLYPSHSKCQTFYNPKWIFLIFSESWQHKIPVFSLAFSPWNPLLQSSLLCFHLFLIGDKHSKECGGYLTKIKFMSSLAMSPLYSYRNHGEYKWRMGDGRGK